MAKDWKAELKDIISSQQNSIKNVIDEREKKELERLKKIKEIKDIIKPRLEYVKELIEKDKYLISSLQSSTVDKSQQSIMTNSTATEPGQMGQMTGQDPTKTESEQFVDACRRGDPQPLPALKEGPSELVLLMPTLSDVNRLDILYQIAFKDEKPVLYAFNLLSAGKMENNGSAHGNFEDFIQDTLKRFLLSWFMRKEGTERDKERKFELRIISHGI